ncbi:hypothetical protein X769_24580 [Mesorhizobium sp. LSJC268A00]|nr:hypothetical protein X769_24580 [Mesorhizobium sp. LSJC268A00]ESZ12899.1 hypothetical protein X735_21270 [Mesorhizobium sp. L2C085B000]ESZ49140.1 hypothetical protein X731_09915 [Mesorhizobium sp. L2C054A000]
MVISEIALDSLDKMSAGTQAPVSQDADGRAGLRATLTAFSRAGLKVAVIRDVPFNDDHVDTCVARALWRGEKPSLCDQKRAEAANDANAAVERNIVRAVPGASYIDMTSQFCDAKTCHVFINGKIAYRDQHHLATPFAETLEPAVEKAVVERVR